MSRLTPTAVDPAHLDRSRHAMSVRQVGQPVGSAVSNCSRTGNAHPHRCGMTAERREKPLASHDRGAQQEELTTSLGCVPQRDSVAARLTATFRVRSASRRTRGPSLRGCSDCSGTWIEVEGVRSEPHYPASLFGSLVAWDYLHSDQLQLPRNNVGHAANMHPFCDGTFMRTDPGSDTRIKAQRLRDDRRARVSAAALADQEAGQPRPARQTLPQVIPPTEPSRA